MDRRYAVRFGNATSSPVRFALGVPQGTVSGPLLFLIYTRSLSQRLAAVNPLLQHQKFVDDLTMWTTCKSMQQRKEIMRGALLVTAYWAKEYKMPFSPGKSEAIWFSLDRRATGQGLNLRLGADGQDACTSPRRYS
jgi:Reverse transcriptase (RNA-dependent DNA polymerase)